MRAAVAEFNRRERRERKERTLDAKFVVSVFSSHAQAITVESSWRVVSCHGTRQRAQTHLLGRSRFDGILSNCCRGGAGSSAWGCTIQERDGNEPGHHEVLVPVGQGKVSA